VVAAVDLGVSRGAEDQLERTGEGQCRKQQKEGGHLYAQVTPFAPLNNN